MPQDRYTRQNSIKRYGPSTQDRINQWFADRWGDTKNIAGEARDYTLGRKKVNPDNMFWWRNILGGLPNLKMSSPGQLPPRELPRSVPSITEPVELVDEDIEQVDEGTPPIFARALRPQTTKSGKDVFLPTEKKPSPQAAKRANKSLDIPSLKPIPRDFSLKPGDYPISYGRPDMMDNVGIEEEQENPTLAAYRQHLDMFPSRDKFKPHWWDKIAASLQAVGGQDPYKHLNRKYEEAVQDWAMKEEPLRKSAELDYKLNNPMNALKYEDLESRIADRDIRARQGWARIDNSARFIDAKIQAMERQGYRTVIGADGLVYSVRGNEVLETGITALEYARLQEAQFVNRQRLRQGNQNIQLRERGAREQERRGRFLYPEDEIQEIR